MLQFKSTNPQILFTGRMAHEVDEAVIVISNFVADHKECKKELTKLEDQLKQLTDSNNKNKHDMELYIEKKIETITSLETQQKSESDYKRKLKETEKMYIDKIRALIQQNIQIKEENEQLRTKLKMHHNETLQITTLEQQNNLLTERIALIEKCMDESERKKEISADCIASLKNENEMLVDRVVSLESEKKLLDDRITSLENENKMLENRVISLEKIG